MSETEAFELADFLPYLLAQAAEAASVEFQRQYRERYGMLRTEWRVLFHLGRYGEMTARDICTRASIHKTKVSRAVKALGEKRFLSRTTSPDDRREELLSLTPSGRKVFDDLCLSAQAFDAELSARLPAEDVARLRDCLRQIAGATRGSKSA